MGTVVDGNNVGHIDGDTERTTTPTDGRIGSGSSSTTSTDSGRTADGSTGRTADGSGRTATEKEIVLELAILTEEEQKQYSVADEKEQKRILRNAKRRERYAKEKAQNGGSVKPRKVRQSKTTETTNTINKDSITMVILSVFGVIASRPNMEHWLLSESEANSISEPLSKMIAENESLANLGQYSNQIALVMACFTIFLPRFIVTVQKSKENKNHAITGNRTKTNVGEIGNNKPKKASDKRADNNNDTIPTTSGTNNGTNEPWYGMAIS